MKKLFSNFCSGFFCFQNTSNFISCILLFQLFFLFISPLILLPLGFVLGIFHCTSEMFLSWFVLSPRFSVIYEDDLCRSALLKKVWQTLVASWSGTGSSGSGLLEWMCFFVFIFSQDIFWTQQHRNAPPYCQGDKPTSSARYVLKRVCGLFPLSR